VEKRGRTGGDGEKKGKQRGRIVGGGRVVGGGRRGDGGGGGV